MTRSYSRDELILIKKGLIDAGDLIFSGLSVKVFRDPQTGDLGAPADDISKALGYLSHIRHLMPDDWKLARKCLRLSALAQIRMPRTLTDPVRRLRFDALRLAAQEMIKNPQEAVAHEPDTDKTPELTRLSDPLEAACEIVAREATLSALELAAQSLADRVASGDLDRGVAFARLFLTAKESLPFASSHEINSAIRPHLSNGHSKPEPEPERVHGIESLDDQSKRQIKAHNDAPLKSLAEAIVRALIAFARLS